MENSFSTKLCYPVHGLKINGIQNLEIINIMQFVICDFLLFNNCFLSKKKLGNITSVHPVVIYTLP